MDIQFEDVIKKNRKDNFCHIYAKFQNSKENLNTLLEFCFDVIERLSYQQSFSNLAQIAKYVDSIIRSEPSYNTATLSRKEKPELLKQVQILSGNYQKLKNTFASCIESSGGEVSTDFHNIDDFEKAQIISVLDGDTLTFTVKFPEGKE